MFFHTTSFRFIAYYGELQGLIVVTMQNETGYLPPANSTTNTDKYPISDRSENMINLFFGFIKKF